MREVELQEMQDRLNQYWDNEEIDVDLANKIADDLQMMINKFGDKIVREK